MTYSLYVIIGVMAGICSGLFGIGGGIIIVPLLVFFARATQHSAVATSLVALLLPVGFMAVYEYYQGGKISRSDIYHGLAIAVGIFAGGYLGARIGLNLSEVTLRRSFGAFAVILGLRLLLAAK